MSCVYRFPLTFGMIFLIRNVLSKVLSLRVDCDCFWPAFGVHFRRFMAFGGLPKTFSKACLKFYSFLDQFLAHFGVLFWLWLGGPGQDFCSCGCPFSSRALGRARGALEVALRNDIRALMKWILERFWIPHSNRNWQRIEWQIHTTSGSLFDYFCQTSRDF